MTVHEVMGGQDLKLHVREWGPTDGPPILLIHGWAQNHLCWKHQYESTLANEFRLVALDLRGHGMSEAPLGTANYVDAQLWADDIAAVIDQLSLKKAILVGWSYGGFIICDYVRAHGTKNISGINFVGAAVTLTTSAFGTLIGPGFLENIVGATSADLPTNIEATRRFLRACTHGPMAEDLFETALCWNMVVPAQVRAALVARQIDSDEVLSALDSPVLVSHGREDRVILPTMAERVLSRCSGAVASWYPNTGHAPFLENPARFNEELTRFAGSARAASPKAVALTPE